jgi:hypothetical protein
MMHGGRAVLIGAARALSLLGTQVWGSVGSVASKPGGTPSDGSVVATIPAGHWVNVNPLDGLEPDRVSGGGGSCPPNTTYTGSDAEWTCVATVMDGSGHVAWIRQGYNRWNGTAWVGFGYEHFYNKHNVWLGTVVNTIATAEYGIRQPNGRYWYGEYFVAPSGQIDQVVNVYEGRNEAPVGNEVGVVTAYCTTGTGGFEATCPDWVNLSQ